MSVTRPTSEATSFFPYLICIFVTMLQKLKQMINLLRSHFQEVFFVYLSLSQFTSAQEEGLAFMMLKKAKAKFTFDQKYLGFPPVSLSDS